jgi:hypothetical protein
VQVEVEVEVEFEFECLASSHPLLRNLDPWAASKWAISKHILIVSQDCNLKAEEGIFPSLVCRQQPL